MPQIIFLLFLVVIIKFSPNFLVTARPLFKKAKTQIFSIPFTII
jgi:uncharacterized membrane protein